MITGSLRSRPSRRSEPVPDLKNTTASDSPIIAQCRGGEDGRCLHVGLPGVHLGTPREHALDARTRVVRPNVPAARRRVRKRGVAVGHGALVRLGLGVNALVLDVIRFARRYFVARWALEAAPVRHRVDADAFLVSAKIVDISAACNRVLLDAFAFAFVCFRVRLERLGCGLAYLKR